MEIHYHRSVTVYHPLLKVLSGLHIEDRLPASAGHSAVRLQQVHESLCAVQSSIARHLHVNNFNFNRNK